MDELLLQQYIEGRIEEIGMRGWVGGWVGGWVVYLSQVSIPVARSGERSASWREANMEE